MIDAIIHRKPVALKAIYYLIEKRLKQGLSFPDPDYNSLLTSNANSGAKNAGDHHSTAFKTTFKSSNQSLDSAAASPAHISATPGSALGGSTGGLTKQNSQLLPKRHTGIQLAQRSSSQKNVDFKSMFNGLNLNPASGANASVRNSGSVLNNYKDSNDGGLNNAGNNSNSPSPDFIAAAMSPIKTLAHSNAANSIGHNHVPSASSARGGGASRLGLSSAASNHTNHTQMTNEAATQQQVVSRKVSQSSSSTNNHANTIGNRVSYPSANHQNAAGGPSEYRAEHRYYAPSSASSQANHRLSQQPVEEAYEAARNSAGLKVTHSVAGSIRSLPSSLYRGSPERGIQKSPDRHHQLQNQQQQQQQQERPASRVSSSSRTGHHHHHHHQHHYQPQQHHYMPEGSVASSTATEKSTGGYELSSNQKLRMANYLATKRSVTSCDEPNYGKNAIGLTASQSVKNRQLHMGKAKIDLETQTSK